MPRFVIHDQLLVDTCRLGRLKLCHVLLHKNSLIPWFILVPEVDGGELLDLPALQRNLIMDECAVIAGFIKQYFHSTRINCATLGNVVSQLHLHVIGRCVTDVCWPRPIWGNVDTEKPYSPVEIGSIRGRLHLDCSLQD